MPAIKDERHIPVEGRVVVNRTRDGGRTFETLSKGLPQVASISNSGAIETIVE